MDIKKLMKQAGKMKKVQKELEKSVVREEIDGVKLAVTGDGKVKNFEIAPEVMNTSAKELEKKVRLVITSCLKKQSDLQQKKVKEAMGGMGGLSGMMG